MSAIAARIAAPLRKRGFDVVKAFQIEWYGFWISQHTYCYEKSKVPVQNPKPRSTISRGFTTCEPLFSSSSPFCSLTRTQSPTLPFAFFQPLDHATWFFPTSSNLFFSNARRKLFSSLPPVSLWIQIIATQSFTPTFSPLYNGAVSTGFQMNNFGRPTSLGLLIGNTRALWTPFVDWLTQQPSRIMMPNPLDSYVSENVESIIADNIKEYKTEIRFSHVSTSSGFGVSMMKVAHSAGLCYMDPDIQLALHPIYGPWIAFRAAVSVDVDASSEEWAAPVNPVPDAVRPDVMTKFAAAMRETRARNRVLFSPMTFSGCVAERWKYWADLRKSIPVGQDWIYSDDQMLYHYTNDRSVLAHAVVQRQKEKLASPPSNSHEQQA